MAEMETITTLPALAAKIAECHDALTHGSDDAMRKLFRTFRMDLSAGLPDDPFSPAYRDFQFGVYETVTGHPYARTFERTEYVTDLHRSRPFPFYTGSTETVGQQLQAIGFLLRRLNLPPGARVLEFGPGWGNTTIAMALLGLRVTAVDIEPNFCDVIRSRAALHQVEIEVVQGEFTYAETVTEPFDAVVFFECFHHCDDHLRLLRALQRAVKPDGAVYLCAEPIVPDYPIPWGLRGDGEALWAIRSFGWLELGFDEAYFRQALERTGWAGTRHACADPDWAMVWELRRAPPPPSEADRLQLERAHAERLRTELEAVYGSTSWRLTAPLRALARLLSRR